MALLYYDESDEVNKIDLNDLYQRDHKRNLKTISTFNKILNRILKRINTAGKCIRNDKHIFYNIPDYIFGEPTYNKSDCIAYIITKLEENTFDVKYIHPNCLFISWSNFIPTFIKNEIKIDNDEKEVVTIQEVKKIPPPISNYKPTGRLIYNDEYFDKIKNKFS
jgi:hypothetical protein